jgi:drug/metabolite transporter (DMT)-like permease
VTVALGLTAAVLWAFVNLRVAAVSRGLDPIVAMFVMLSASILVTVPLALAVDGLPSALHGRAVAAAALAGLLEISGFVCYLKAVQRGSMAVVAPLIGLEGGVAAVIAVIGGEPVSVTLGAAITVAVVGTALACASPGERTAAGAGWAILAGLQFGVMLTLFGATNAVGSFTAVSVARAAGLIVLVPILLARRRPHTERRVIGSIALSGVVDAFAFGAFTAAAAIGPVSVASVCAAQFSTISVVFAIVLLRDRPAPIQVVGIALTLVGTTVIAAS